MAIDHTLNLSLALQQVGFSREPGEQRSAQDFPLHETEELRTDDVLNKYGEAKWAIIELLNNHYAQNDVQNDVHYDLYNWLLENKEDEVAYFLNEGGSNCLTHSQYKAPSKFKVWLGKKGFVIGIEQKGNGFNVEKVSRYTPGGFFNFFSHSNSVIFFDHLNEARTVFMLVLRNQFSLSSGQG